MPLIIVTLDRVYVSQDLQEIEVNHASRMFHFLKFPILSSDFLHPNVSSKIINWCLERVCVLYNFFFLGINRKENLFSLCSTEKGYIYFRYRLH